MASLPKLQQDSYKLLFILLHIRMRVHSTLQKTSQVAHICAAHLKGQGLLLTQFSPYHLSAYSQNFVLTNSTGNDPSMLLNSSRSVASPLNINVDKWKSLTLSGISVYLAKSLRISRSCTVLDRWLDMEISMGVSLTSSQTAVGSTLRENHYQLVKRKLKFPPKFKQILNKVYFAHLHCILENCPPC